MRAAMEVRLRSTPNSQFWELGVRGWQLIRCPRFLEPRSEIELPEPAATRPIERTHVVDLRHREAEHVDAHRDADTDDRLSIAGTKARTRAAIPGHAGVGEERHLDRQRTVEVVPAKRAPQREPELGVCYRDLAADEPVEHWAVTV